MNIVSLITCTATGLSYVGATKNGRLDDPSLFSPRRYGSGRRFVEAVRRYGPNAFTVEILGHGYATCNDLYVAKGQFIEEHNTVWPHGYNVLRVRNGRLEFPGTAAQRLSRDPRWRAAIAAAASKRKQSIGWRVALRKRSRNTVWRRNISSARLPYLHARWHVKAGLVPPDTTVEHCDRCKAVVLRKIRRKMRRRMRGKIRSERTVAEMSYVHRRWHVNRGLVPEGTAVENCELCKTIAHYGKNCPPKAIELRGAPPPYFPLVEELDYIARRAAEMFGQQSRVRKPQKTGESAMRS